MNGSETAAFKNDSFYSTVLNFMQGEKSYFAGIVLLPGG
jgi:hypothetical protein